MTCPGPGCEDLQGHKAHGRNLGFFVFLFRVETSGRTVLETSKMVWKKSDEKTTWNGRIYRYLQGFVHVQVVQDFFHEQYFPLIHTEERPLIFICLIWNWTRKKRRLGWEFARTSEQKKHTTLSGTQKTSWVHYFGHTPPLCWASILTKHLGFIRVLRHVKTSYKTILVSSAEQGGGKILQLLGGGGWVFGISWPDIL